jgi:hypothetical protein
LRQALQRASLRSLRAIEIEIDRAVGMAAAAYFMDARARFDLADFARQLAWLRAQGLIDKIVDVQAMVVENYIAGRWS